MKKFIAQTLAILVLASFAAFVAGCGGSGDTGAKDAAPVGDKAPADKTPDAGGK